MTGRVQDHPLYRHVERVIERKYEVPDYVGATLTDQRFIDWARRGGSREELQGVFREMKRDPVTSVLVVLEKENPKSRGIIDALLDKVPHGVLIWGQGNIWPNLALLKRE